MSLLSTTEDVFDLGRARLPPDTVAIVTGAAEGLGKSFAEGLLDKGAKGVCIADVNEALGSETARELSDRFGEDRVLFVKCDVTSAAEIEAAFAKTKEKFGTVTLMVNNAGVCNEKDVELTVKMNIIGVTYGTYAAVKYMSPVEGGRGGKIINISSQLGLQPRALLPVYGASKAAVVGLTRALIADPRLSAQGVGFGVLCPSRALTRFFDKWVLRNPAEDLKMAGKVLDRNGMMAVSVVRDAFLQLVLDDSWSGRVMVVSKDEGIFDGLV